MEITRDSNLFGGKLIYIEKYRTLYRIVILCDIVVHFHMKNEILEYQRTQKNYEICDTFHGKLLRC